MKKINIILAALAIAAASSCSYEEHNVTPEVAGPQPAEELVPLCLTTGEMTKTSLQGTTVNWTSDDEIAVFDNVNYPNRFTAVSVEGPLAVFEGLVGAATTEFYAVYPYSSAKSIDASNITVTLPAAQTSAAGTFAEEHNISVAYGVKEVGEENVEGIKFDNVCGLIQFTVPQRVSAVKNVVFKAENRSLAGDLVISKDGFKVESVANGTNSVSMSGDFAAGSTFYFVVAPGEVKGFSITVTAQNGATYSKVSSKSFTVAAAAMKNLGVIDFKAEPGAKAEHTYSDGTLTGTKVTLNPGLPAGMEAYVENLTASMTKNGIEYRRISKSSAYATEIMEVANGMTYVPQGEYVVEYTYTLNGVAETKTVNVTVPAPTFTVSASAYTSYSKYLEGNISAANNCAPESIYDIKCSVSISAEVLKQLEMSSCTVTLKQPSGSETSLSGSVNKKASTYLSTSQYNVSEWGAYTLSSVVTFDGVTKSCPPKTLHITGLPYKAPSMVESDWELASWNCEYSNGTIQLGAVSGSGECTATSKMAFAIPADINIKVNANVTVRAYYLWPIWYNTDFTIKVNGTQIIKQNSNKQDNKNTGKNYNLSGNAAFTPSGCSVVMNSSYTMAGPWSKIHSMEILYR
jgi:hypothetical protein